jgi:hypothetical protein
MLKVAEAWMGEDDEGVEEADFFERVDWNSEERDSCSCWREYGNVLCLNDSSNLGSFPLISCS